MISILFALLFTKATECYIIQHHDVNITGEENMSKHYEPVKRRYTTGETKRIVSVHLTVKEYNKVRRMAEKTAMSMSGLCANAILKYVQDQS